MFLRWNVEYSSDLAPSQFPKRKFHWCAKYTGPMIEARTSNAKIVINKRQPYLSDTDRDTKEEF